MNLAIHHYTSASSLLRHARIAYHRKPQVEIVTFNNKVACHNTVVRLIASTWSLGNHMARLIVTSQKLVYSGQLRYIWTQKIIRGH